MAFNQNNWDKQNNINKPPPSKIHNNQTSSDLLRTIKNETNPKYEARMIEDSHIRKLRPAFTKTFEDIEIDCVDFSECGDFTLCSTREFLKIYKIDEYEPIECKITTRDGFQICKFQKGFKLLHTTARNGVNYLDFESKSYLHKYTPESSKITSLSVMKSSENHFAIASQNLVKIFDLRREKPITVLNNNFNPIVACHPIKRKFAVAFAMTKISYTIEIYYYDNPKYAKKFSIENYENYMWTDLKFSDCGKMMLACTRNSVIVVLDASDGSILHELKGKKLL